MQRSISRLLTTATIALMFLVLATTPAFATTSVDAGAGTTVTLIVDTPDSLYYDFEPFHWEDTVAFQPGMTALDLIDTVVAARGSTYTVTWADLDGDGTADDAFVDEVNGVATDFSLGFVGRYWALYENGEATPTGAAKTVLQEGDVIQLVYEGFPVTF